MSYLDTTWQQGALEAMQATFKDVDRHLKKAMIEFLLDEGFWDRSKLTWEGATARFNSCCNPNKDEYFKLSEAWALMKRFGRYQLLQAMATDFGFELRPIPTEARRQDLLERIAHAMESCDATVAGARAELARLEISGPARLHPSIAQGSAGARFSLPAEPDADGPGRF